MDKPIDIRHGLRLSIKTTHYFVLNFLRQYKHRQRKANKMNSPGQPNTIDFSVDKNNLYREESFTDLKVASIRRLFPVNLDGTEDNDRTPIFVGHTQLMSQEGPLPIQARLSATTIEDALKEFPSAMEKALAEMVEKIKQVQAQQQQQQQQQQRDQSRIIIPGR